MREEVTNWFAVDKTHQMDKTMLHLKTLPRDLESIYEMIGLLCQSELRNFTSTCAHIMTLRNLKVIGLLLLLFWNTSSCSGIPIFEARSLQNNGICK